MSLLGSLEHSLHHTPLLLEIKALAERHPSLLGGGAKDVYRMSNSFTAIARELGRRLEDNASPHCRWVNKTLASANSTTASVCVCVCPLERKVQPFILRG